MKKLLLETRGAALIVTVLIISALVFSLFLSFARVRLDTIDFVGQEWAMSSARNRALGCLDEVLAYLRVNSDFEVSPSDVLLNQCEIYITAPISDRREIVVSALQNDGVYSLKAGVTLDPFALATLVEGE